MNLLLFGAVLIIVGVVVAALFAKDQPISKYTYTRKQYFMSRAESEFYRALRTAVGDSYIIFAQVHLDRLIDNKVVGQNWRAARARMSQKSVDFVLCNPTTISPLLAIELDDGSHELQDRRDRDSLVEHMLNGAGMPLLRIENHGSFSPNDLALKINNALAGK